MKISEIISGWYKKNRRDLPWRKTTDPYKIWLSEIILQQTRVNQGLDYYRRFLANFPDIASLASADLQEVLKLWQGLGYYTRARNLHKAARQITRDHHGVFPDNYEDIIALSGIGKYTAAAIASFAYGKPYSVVDGNVSRVISRLFAVKDPVNMGKGSKIIEKLADEIMDRENPGDHNQAMMEFGALQCIPVNPNCEVCPLNVHCQAFSKSMVGQLPAKKKKTAVRKRYFTYFIITNGDSIYLGKRTSDDIWNQLYEFPLMESEKLPPEQEVIDHLLQMTNLSAELITVVKRSDVIRHQLTHQLIYARFIHIIASRPPQFPGKKWNAIPVHELHDLPLPRLIDRYLEQNDI